MSVKFSEVNSISEAIATKLVVRLAKMLAESDGLEKSGRWSNRSPGHADRMKAHTKDIRKRAKAAAASDEEGAPIGKRGAGETSRTVRVQGGTKKVAQKAKTPETRASAMGHSNAGKFDKQGKAAPDKRQHRAIAATAAATKPMSKHAIDRSGTARQAQKAGTMDKLRKFIADRKARKANENELFDIIEGIVKKANKAKKNKVIADRGSRSSATIYAGQKNGDTEQKVNLKKGRREGKIDLSPEDVAYDAKAARLYKVRNKNESILHILIEGAIKMKNKAMKKAGEKKVYGDDPKDIASGRKARNATKDPNSAKNARDEKAFANRMKSKLFK